VQTGVVTAAVMDDDTRYRAVLSRDARFDGCFVTAVRTTRIYCRPSCPARTPRRENVRFLPGAAAAQRAGFRPCRRCRPDASPGSAEWNVRGDIAARALRLIADGVIEREGVAALAGRVGYSPRQLQRTLVAEVGAGPLAIARAQRVQTARLLLETTDLPISDVAFAAGFGSIRQFNDTVRAALATSPTALRAAPARRQDVAAGVIDLRLPYREPMTLSATLDFLGAHAVPGLEDHRDGAFTRVVAAPSGPALVTLLAGDGAVRCRARLHDLRDLTAVVARVRRLLDLDADPVAVDAALAVDASLAPLVAKRPGLRAPGTVDGFETAVRTVVGQQISLRGARTVLGRMVADHGEPVFPGETWRAFPRPEVLAALDPSELPMPRARARAVIAVATAVVEGTVVLDLGADRAATRAALVGLPGVGGWTADYLRMRATGDPDVLLATDLVVRRAAADLDVDLADGRPQWAPWRTYATYHLWAHLYADEWRTQP
jgi:AraC family transcriptional regulator of adaptative response / DNA-3-methyladenine glycosylase II